MKKMTAAQTKQINAIVNNSFFFFFRCLPWPQEDGAHVRY